MHIRREREKEREKGGVHAQIDGERDTETEGKKKRERGGIHT